MESDAWGLWAQLALGKLEESGARFLPLGRERKLEARSWLRLERFLRRERVDVLHSHKFGSNLWGTLVGRAARVPVVIAHEHSWSYQGQPLRRLLDRYVIAAGADRFIAVSQADRRRMTEVEGISPERTLFIPNGIPSSQATAGRDLRAELGIDPSAPVIGSVGSLYPVKAFDVLLRATVTLVRDRPDTKLLLVGEGAQREALEALSRELRLESSVRFLGDRGDVRDILETFNVAVCCSWSEGSPLSVMEYMDAGLPVVATTVGGLPDLVAPDVNGLLVAPGDPSALAASISVLLADPERARAMGARGAERRSREFDIDVLAGRLGDLYIELLEQKAARRAR